MSRVSGPNAFLVIGLALFVAGFTLGAAAVLQVAPALPIAQLHGQVLAFGALPMIVCGFALRLLPRFFSTPHFRGRLPGAVFIPLIASIALRAIDAFVLLPAATMLAGPLTMISGLAFAAAVTSVARAAVRPRPDLALFVVAALWLPAGGVLDVLGARAAALDALLWGFTGGHILAVFARTAPAFVAARPPGAAAVAIAGGLWHVGIAAAVSGVLPGWSVTLAGAFVLVTMTRLYGRGIARTQIPPAARLTRTALRFAFGWLAVALALLSLRALEASYDLTTSIGLGVSRHIFALGFVLPVVYAYGARLVPALAGGAPPSPRVLRSVFVLANLAAVLRMLSELVVPDPLLAKSGLLLSGVAAGIAMLLFGWQALRALPRGGLPLA